MSETSVALDGVLLVDIDQDLEPGESRSAFIEWATRDLLKRRTHQRHNERDAAIFSANTESLNQEALENLEFVSDVFVGSGLEPV